MENFKNKVTMSLEDWKNYSNDEDFEFAYATIEFLSTRPNTHKHIYSEEVIREYADSILGKWLIAKLNIFEDDFEGHHNKQVIMGVVPSNSKVQYKYDEDGYLVAYTDVVISKLYATKMYEIFKQTPNKSISIEELVGFTEETENYKDGVQEKIVKGFHITGITVLGENINPSIPYANIQITQMSDEFVSKMEQEYEKYNYTNMYDNILDKLNSMENLLKEEVMAKKKDEVLEENVNINEVENQEQEAEQVENACGEENVENAEEVENPNPKDEEKVEIDYEAQLSELKEQLSNQEAKIQEYEAMINEKDIKIAELQEFKNVTETNLKNSIVMETLSKAKEFVDAEAYAKFEEASKSYAYANINTWKNEVMASITENALNKMAQLTSKEDGVLDLGIPMDNSQEKTSIYD